MRVPRLKLAMKFILDYAGEALMWLGIGMGAPYEMCTTSPTEITQAKRAARSTNQPPDADIIQNTRPATPLSNPVHTEREAVTERPR